MQFHIPYHVYTDKYPSKRLALYHAIRDCITSEVLVMNTRLPSSRELAALYGVSRGTVSQVYDMLSSEGYITSGVGRGTFVSFQSPKQRSHEFPHLGVYLLSDWGNRLDELKGWRTENIWDHHCEGLRIVDFQAFGPDSQWFPDKEWNRCLYAQARLLANNEQKHTDISTLGDESLRESIAQYVRRARGIAADADQIAVFNGSKQALALTAQLIINPGDRVVVENPGYTGAVKAFQALGGICVHAPVDAQGIIPDNWEAKLLLVTPNRQFPTGAVLTMERRQQLLAWASENNSLILEDDYDSVFRHRGKSLEPLKVLDREGRVIYVGSFSSTLLPHVRIGYAVLPASLIQLFSSAKTLFEPYPSNLLEQRTLAAWMQSGQYERHLRRMKRVYGRKFKLLRELLTSRLSSLFMWIEGDAGLSMFGWWRGSAEQYIKFRSRCFEAGIRWSDTSVQEMAHGSIRYGAYFYFPRLSEEAMVYGVNKMREIWLAIESQM
ncbi:PLP-dependent aminotransferase family protein [Paenibacillus apiarius]|uniref:MocR-like pyridoxine biosynthesis transcription factor PdxR n=1 Tax=Paenibacillus apiarius TaxID=46240 RepID=UPI001980EA05|nr:PLP-dependent aminotransferase family protein [Paenibacillus apiarius]MBN3525833.1 PLP-dependent aminotransferase family protein [Paenibacillus apiarius]